MGKKPEAVMRQTALRLPNDLYERLQRAGGEGGVGEEVRRRLEASFAAEKPPANPKTQELLGVISFVADKTDFYRSDWSKDPFAFAVLKAAVDLMLTARRPKGEAVKKPDTSAVSDLFFDAESTPEDIAKFILAEWTWAKRTEDGKRSK